VWLADEDIPGLAMSRSIGDHVAAMAGVSSQAEIKKHELDETDKVIVLGSDGLFEFLSNEELLKLVVPFVEVNNPKGAAEKLVQAAEARWRTVRTI
jgi:serine/threonine protein phosphatase PrpC